MSLDTRGVFGLPNIAWLAPLPTALDFQLVIQYCLLRPFSDHTTLHALVTL
jgi:hypothetical protein